MPTNTQIQQAFRQLQADFQQRPHHERTPLDKGIAIGEFLRDKVFMSCRDDGSITSWNREDSWALDNMLKTMLPPIPKTKAGLKDRRWRHKLMGILACYLKLIEVGHGARSRIQLEAPEAMMEWLIAALKAMKPAASVGDADDSDEMENHLLNMEASNALQVSIVGERAVDPAGNFKFITIELRDTDNVKDAPDLLLSLITRGRGWERDFSLTEEEDPYGRGEMERDSFPSILMGVKLEWKKAFKSGMQLLTEQRRRQGLPAREEVSLGGDIGLFLEGDDTELLEAEARRWFEVSGGEF